MALLTPNSGKSVHKNLLFTTRSLNISLVGSQHAKETPLNFKNSFSHCSLSLRIHSFIVPLANLRKTPLMWISGDYSGKCQLQEAALSQGSRCPRSSQWVTNTQ